MLGSEPELLQRYGISRAVFREAARIVELQAHRPHAARPGWRAHRHRPVGRRDRRCRGGVPVLREGRRRRTVRGAGRGRIGSGRGRSRPPRRARNRRDPIARAAGSRIVRAGEDVVDYRAFHRLVATVSGNPAIEFFVELLNRSTYLFLAPRTQMSARIVDESAHAHAAIASAILSGNGGLASSRMRKHLDAEGAFLRRRRSGSGGRDRRAADRPQRKAAGGHGAEDLRGCRRARLAGR